ncbi:Unknown protein, partial [Striga hermonthica]
CIIRADKPLSHTFACTKHMQIHIPHPLQSEPPLPNHCLIVSLVRTISSCTFKNLFLNSWSSEDMDCLKNLTVFTF